jgi:hypothetical protein
VQLVAEGQETPSSSLLDTPDGVGVGWIAQVLPFQCSASVLKPDFVL